jgi:predicted nucleotidyltransferase
VVAERIDPEKKIAEFVQRIRSAGQNNLQSVILYGSAASGEFHQEFSDINILCVLRDTSFAALTALVPTVEWWRKQKNPPPLVMTQPELQRSTDVFIIELLDMQRHHRVLYGDDVLGGLPVSVAQHRVQVEYELREKLIIFRQNLLYVNGDKQQLWGLMLNSLPSFTTLFRHALMVLTGNDAPSKRAAIESLAQRIQFDASGFLQVLDVREHNLDRKQLDLKDVCTRYLKAVQQVTDAVDTMLENRT